MAEKERSRKSKKGQLKRQFGKLHWKLTISYTGVTLAALILLEAIVLFGGLAFLNWFFRGPLLPRAIENTYGRQIISSAQPYLQDSPRDLNNLKRILNSQVREANLSNNTGTQTQLIIVDQEGNSLASIGFDFQDSPDGQSKELVFQKLSMVISEIIQTNGQKSIHTYVRDSLVIGIPIFTEGDPKSMLGILGMVTSVPSIDFDFIYRLLPIILISLGVFSLSVAMIGTLFGYFTSKGLVSRIQDLSQATDQWRKGNFKETIRDDQTDELADLGKKMNNMARQLNDLIDERKMLAVIEERNRIARDLHDSVKQKAYAAAGQISGAQEILSRQPEKASSYLTQADELLHEIRHELTLLINELKPIELQEKTLLEAIGDYLENWSKRNEISIKFITSDQLDLDEDIETAVFRLIQEATSNIARHSQANNVLVHIAENEKKIEIVIADDGLGFEKETATKGFGLDSIKERFELNQRGSVAISSQPGEGTTIRTLISKDEGNHA